MSKKNISRLIFGIILVGFFLPFVTVTFFVKVTFNGFQLIMGDKNYYITSYASAVFAFLAAIGGFGASFIEKRKSEISATAVSIIGIIALIALGSTLTEGVAGSLVSLQFGLYMNVLLLAAAGLVNILSMKEDSEGKLANIFAPKVIPNPSPSSSQYHETNPLNTVPVLSIPVLHGITGQYSGKSFSLSNKIILGRDPGSCNVTFAHDTPEISRLHCEVSFDSASNSFILQDNGSSFGTFLASGDKLTNGQPYAISSGGRFYLANTTNMFEVSLQ